jgi:hypothetical protein
MCLCTPALLPLPSLPQGDHCAEIVLTVSDFEVGNTRGKAVPKSVSSTQKICWFKVSRQPTAKFDFDMCTNKKCEWQGMHGTWGLGLWGILFSSRAGKKTKQHCLGCASSTSSWHRYHPARLLSTKAQRPRILQSGWLVV